MKTCQILLTTVLLLTVGTFITNAQTTVYYKYDLVGNRDLRTTVLSVSNSHVSKTTKIDSTDLAATDDGQTLKKYEEALGSCQVQIFPNPTVGNVHVEIQSENANLTPAMYLYSIQGTLLINKEHATMAEDFDLTKYSTGIYIMRIVVDGKVSEWKIVKQ